MQAFKYREAKRQEQALDYAGQRNLVKEAINKKNMLMKEFSNQFFKTDSNFKEVQIKREYDREFDYRSRKSKPDTGRAERESLHASQINAGTVNISITPKRLEDDLPESSKQDSRIPSNLGQYMGAMN